MDPKFHRNLNGIRPINFNPNYYITRNTWVHCISPSGEMRMYFSKAKNFEFWIFCNIVCNCWNGWTNKKASSTFINFCFSSYFCRTKPKDTLTAVKFDCITQWTKVWLRKFTNCFKSFRPSKIMKRPHNQDSKWKNAECTLLDEINNVWNLPLSQDDVDLWSFKDSSICDHNSGKLITIWRTPWKAFRKDSIFVSSMHACVPCVPLVTLA